MDLLQLILHHSPSLLQRVPPLQHLVTGVCGHLQCGGGGTVAVLSGVDPQDPHSILGRFNGLHSAALDTDGSLLNTAKVLLLGCLQEGWGEAGEVTWGHDRPLDVHW